MRYVFILCYALENTVTIYLILINRNIFKEFHYWIFLFYILLFYYTKIKYFTLFSLIDI